MIDLGLSRITRLTKKLSKPTWAAIHIAGTNGKGSVAAYLSSLFLRLSKPKLGELTIGRFTSPHLIDRWDCITINDKPVSESLFLAVEERIKSTVVTEIKPQLADAGQVKVTEFELLTATAFEIFSQQKCQLAVIECGLGGRLDATNALEAENVAVSVVTKIGLDHQGLLGNTIEDIAKEKIGIAKPKVPVVVDESNLKSVQQVISQSAEEAGAGQVVLTAHSTSYPSLDLPLHQRQNLSVALTAYELAAGRVPGLEIEPASESTIPQVIADVRKSYPGRLQHISIAPLVPGCEKKILLDGAHNAQSANVLRQYVDNNLPMKPKCIIWILAMSQGKDVSEILRILLRKEDYAVACGFGPVDGMPWVKSVDASTIKENATKIVAEAEICVNVVDALNKVGHLSHGPNTSIVVAGSLYLVSDLLRALQKANKTI